MVRQHVLGTAGYLGDTLVAQQTGLQLGHKCPGGPTHMYRKESTEQPACLFVRFVRLDLDETWQSQQHDDVWGRVMQTHGSATVDKYPLWIQVRTAEQQMRAATKQHPLVYVTCGMCQIISADTVLI